MSELRCRICGISESETSRFYKTSIVGENLCNKHYIQLYRHGEIRDGVKRLTSKDKKCVICGDTEDIRHCHVDDVKDEYKNKPLCKYHYGQCLRYGYIKDFNISTRKLERKCCVCGITKDETKIIYHRDEGNMYCLRHYSQIKNLGGLKDRTKRDTNIVEFKKLDGEVVAEIVLEDRYLKETARTIVDIDDYKKHFKNVRVGYDSNGYAIVDGRYIQRMILGTDELIDHINTNGLDNRKRNLRIADKSTNSINAGKRSNNKSGFTGVSITKYGTWRAYYSCEGKRVEIGCFKNKIDAVEARIIAEFRYFKEFRHNHNCDEYIKKYGEDKFKLLMNKVKEELYV